jgi:hypothetical protein
MSETQTQTDTSTTQPINLQLTDLVTVLEVLQLASSRGAFKPEEFTAIGSVYERIFAFLETTGAVSRPAPAEQPQGN